MNARGIIAHIRGMDLIESRFTPHELALFYTACYAPGPALLVHDISDELAARMKEFADRHRAAELLIPESEWSDPEIARRRARLARRGRTLAQIMGVFAIAVMAGCAHEPTTAELYPWTVTAPWACHMEDSCGIYPPYRDGAEYCGPPQIVCPGERWMNPTEAARTRGGVRYDEIGMSRKIACGDGK